MESKIIKGITVTMFSTLIFLFVAYRSGYLGGLKSTYQVSPNGSALNNQTDTLPKNDSIKRIEMISPSKVVILSDQSLQDTDSSEVKTDSIKKIKSLIYSSKTGIILTPEHLRKTKSDTTVNDSLKNKNDRKRTIRNN